MGATAFVIAQFLNVSYAEVALAAVIPAALYYLGLFMQVDSYAARHGLKGLPREPSCRASGTTLKEGWYYVFVIALLIVMLLHFKRESHAPFYATALLLVLNQLFSRETRWTFKRIGDFLEAERPDIRRARRHSGRVRAPDRRLLDDGRRLEPRQRSAAHRRRQRPAAACDVRDHQPRPRPRPHDHGLLHLPRDPRRAGARENWASTRWPCTCSSSTGACCHRSRRRWPSPRSPRPALPAHPPCAPAGKACGSAASSISFPSSSCSTRRLSCREARSTPCCFGRQCRAIGILFICGGIQGYQAGIGDLRTAGVLEWPLRIMLVSAASSSRRREAASCRCPNGRYRRLA